MNGNEPKIEIFEPFGAAFELMKGILFRPFDLGKWCVIAFAAFLSGSWGGGFRMSFPWDGDWKFRSTSHQNMPGVDSLPAWTIPLIIALAVVVFILILVFMWLGARGRFIFTDCVVKNRAAIVAPWKEFRREGNSFFLFSLVVGVVALLAAAAFFLVVLMPMGILTEWRGAGMGVALVLALIFLALVWLVCGVFFGLVTAFMVPVMYRRRCTAWHAFMDVSKLILARPGPFILFALFGLVLLVALGVAGTILSCLTCCIAGFPYIGTVVLLPALVWLLAFKLLFLRQFGAEYDVWAVSGDQEVAAPALALIEPPSDPSAGPID
jgi:hypothetical protein